MRILPTALLAASAATLALAGSARATVISPLLPPAGNVPFDAALAVGVQTYKCDGTTWTFTGPRANLYNPLGRVVMTHYAGPTWETRDGSKVVGAVVASQPAANGAIPHLLLRAASTTPGKLEKTTYIQRLATAGGVAPAAAKCNAASAGQAAEVPYTAAYAFWRSLYK